MGISEREQGETEMTNYGYSLFGRNTKIYHATDAELSDISTVFKGRCSKRDIGGYVVDVPPARLTPCPRCFPAK